MNAVCDLGVPFSEASLTALADDGSLAWADGGELNGRAQSVQRTQLGVFSAMWVLIGAVSAFDTYLTVRYQETLVLLECNPVALWLLAYDEWNPATLVALKFLGSMIVLGVLALSFRWRPRWGMFMSLSIALFQTALLGFLVLA